MPRELESVINGLKKTFGEDVIKSGNEMRPVQAITTSIPTLDIDLGGGWLMGRTNLLAGKRATGKTALGLKLAAYVQQKYDFPVFWMDVEKAYDKVRAEFYGVNTAENFYVIQGDELVAENVFTILRDIIRAVKKSDDTRALFVVDSLASMTSDKIVENPASETYGGSSLIINQAINVWNTLLKWNQVLLLINELRDNVGGMGEPDRKPGGKAQDYIASTEVWLTAGETIKDGLLAVGQGMKWTVKKSRSSAPKDRGEIKLLYNEGFMVDDCLIDGAVELGIIEQVGGGWYTLPDGSRIRSKDALKDKIKEDREFMAGLFDKIHAKLVYPQWQPDSTNGALTEDNK